MANLRKSQLFDIVVRSVAESGWNILYLSTLNEHPFKMQIYRDDESIRIRIYIWNLTRGGGKARPKNEYRIQITGLSVNYFEPEPSGKTLILGWWDEVGVFAGFDFNKHPDKLGKSASIQIREETLQKAHINGFSTGDKGNQEIAIAFKPSFFVEYVKNLELLHSFGESKSDLEFLESVAEDPQAINNSTIEQTSAERKTTVISVRKKLRDSSFQDRVLTAYGYHCAICGIQLNLVQAAHILPVSHERSTDLTSNGVALCALHHYAYDRALLYIDEEYFIRINEKRVAELIKISRDAGLETFKQALRAIILLPPERENRPHLENIRLANVLRLGHAS